VLQLLCQGINRLVDFEGKLLQAPRDLDGPSFVAEVPLELADDRRSGVGRELDLTLDIEAIDSLDEAYRADLYEVVDRLSAIAESARKVLHEVQVHGDELVSRLLVALETIAAEQLPGVGLVPGELSRLFARAVPNRYRRRPHA
jgi:hypothetical protein